MDGTTLVHPFPGEVIQLLHLDDVAFHPGNLGNGGDPSLPIGHSFVPQNALCRLFQRFRRKRRGRLRCWGARLEKRDQAALLTAEPAAGARQTQ
ncbi:hypothetical protein [Mangrovicoccus ximenensis]|uniref:hypothetical protein n=1 Tax=Mangrovicoccus ximenensis TaxID=1911570 RepID=UPI001374AEF5|nr:hypothetical protein [Mangrovicoccus ximenensis]